MNVIFNIYKLKNNKTNEQIQIHTRTGNQTQDFLHSSLMRYLDTTEATECIDWSHAVFQRKEPSHTQSQIREPHLFSLIGFFFNILIGMNNNNWQFRIFTGDGVTALVWLKCKT